jgi:hypothetical protein
LSAQFFQAILQPDACPPSLFVFGIEFVVDIGIRDRIGDFGGFSGLTD